MYDFYFVARMMHVYTHVRRKTNTCRIPGTVLQFNDRYRSIDVRIDIFPGIDQPMVFKDLDMLQICRMVGETKVNDCDVDIKQTASHGEFPIYTHFRRITCFDKAGQLCLDERRL